jgi:hypothetical protein
VTDVSPISGASDPAAREAAVTDGPGSWACLDWRFMLPLPGLGAVWVAPDCAEEAAAMRALGLRVCADGEPADTVVARGATADLPALVARLRSGPDTGPEGLPDTGPDVRRGDGSGDRTGDDGGAGLVKLSITGRPPRAGLFGVLRPWNAWRRRLRAAGLDVVVEAIALPNAQRATTMIDLDQPLALRLALRRQPASRKGRALGQIAEIAVRLGLRQLVFRQGVVVAVVSGSGAR